MCVIDWLLFVCLGLKSILKGSTQNSDKDNSNSDKEPFPSLSKTSSFRTANGDVSGVSGTGTAESVAVLTSIVSAANSPVSIRLFVFGCVSLR